MVKRNLQKQIENEGNKERENLNENVSIQMEITSLFEKV
jgi:hypothetical protein